MSAFLSAFVIGVAVAAPVGPVGVLCMQRTLRGGAPLGIASGMGVATADGLYAGLAALGIAAVARAAAGLAQPMHVVGGIVLLALAWRAWRASGPGATCSAAVTRRGLLAAYGSALGLTLANPATILSFAGIMAGLGAGVASPADGPLFVAGIATGSLAWWVALTTVIALARTKASPAFVAGASRASSAVLGAAGVVVLVSAGMALI